MSKISAVVITFNEEKNISRCLKSLKGVADEVLVYDSYSSDTTKRIAEEAGARVVQGKWQGYSATKNEANSLVQHDYILSIDADEVLSDVLSEQIKKAKNAGLKGAYSFNRLNNYCSRWIWHGGYYPDRKVRLFNRHEARWEGAFVHEVLKLQEGVATAWLKGDLLHYTYADISDHIARANRYSSLAAKQIAATGKAGPVKGIFSAWFRFVRNYFFRGGFMDGRAGFNLHLIAAFEVFLKYAKAYEISRQKNQAS